MSMTSNEVDKTQRFLQQNPKGKVINIGAGLDTRFTRVDNGELKWFDLDMPEVIKLREKFFSESDRVKFISKSVLDSSWVDDIGISPEEPVLIIAEGILMYLKEEDVKRVFSILAGSFPGAEMYFDVVHTYFVGKGVSSDFVWVLLSETGARYYTLSLRTKIDIINQLLQLLRAFRIIPNITAYCVISPFSGIVKCNFSIAVCQHSTNTLCVIHQRK